ncbi:sulfate/molybdate ABC transporter ATP-binding protein [Fusibacter ferrireducens]|uniref:ATP-binding cassette domain-containing protein n=1 Tax=Fusibacter ferrireducens TaxID=2785058 RepID=A0ABR9ZRN6_9FIRM|nr:ATP-binding cassette domain-containing protein [Fusibacter ferrireducens]MBF4692641.1 ATP-binding cassette domain-containing protein [Fusibacter ferrireducens]
MSIQIDIQKKLQGFHLDLSLHTEASILGILGASGSGKSMLLKCIAGLVKPDSGCIEINKRTFFSSHAHINLKPRDRKTGYVFQNYALFPHLTVRENIAFGLHRKRDDQETNLITLISKLHLNGLEHKYPSQISGGQQQRVALARALATNPDMLLLDEPFSALDEHLRKEMIKEMAQYLSLFKVKTLYVTHQMDEAYYLCDDIAVIKQGQIDSISHKTTLFTNPLTLESAKITGCKNFSKFDIAASQKIICKDWGIELPMCLQAPAASTKCSTLGIRNHHLKCVDASTASRASNQIQGWISDIVKMPTQSTLYVKFNRPPSGPEDYHVQLDVPHEKRAQIKEMIFVEFPTDRLLFLED